MNCSKCDTQNPPGNQFCTDCGNSLSISSSSVSQPTPPTSANPYAQTLSKKHLIISAVILLLLFFLGGGFFLSSKLRKSSLPVIPSGEKVVSTKNANNTYTDNKNSCKKINAELLLKYKQDYDSCLKSIETFSKDCKKPTELTDSFKENLNVLIILDASGSMVESVSGSQKMQIAKNVINQFVDTLPARTKIGLMIYGHKGSNSESQKSLSCSTIEMVYPISELNKASFTTAVNSFNPTGWTAVGGSLLKAKEILSSYSGETNSNLIYLVSDGIETCGGDPVTAAKDLNTSNIKAIVNIIGFNVDNQAQVQLQSAAQSGGGKYYQANTAEEMTKVFNDQKEYLKNITEYRNCIQSAATKNRISIQSTATEIRDCLQSKATHEKDGVQNEVSSLRDKKEIDNSCWVNIYYGASSKWVTIYYGASKNWVDTYYGASKNWVDEYYGKKIDK